jgi:hypothetical protein
LAIGPDDSGVHFDEERFVAALDALVPGVLRPLSDNSYLDNALIALKRNFRTVRRARSDIASSLAELLINPAMSGIPPLRAPRSHTAHFPLSNLIAIPWSSEAQGAFLKVIHAALPDLKSLTSQLESFHRSLSSTNKDLSQDVVAVEKWIQTEKVRIAGIRDPTLLTAAGDPTVAAPRLDTHKSIRLRINRIDSELERRQQAVKWIGQWLPTVRDWWIISEVTSAASTADAERPSVLPDITSALDEFNVAVDRVGALLLDESDDSPTSTSPTQKPEAKGASK